jgi:hypothetical protein
MIFIVVAGLLYYYDVFQMRTYIDASPLTQRFKEEGMETPRTEIIRYYFEHMFDNVWGGGKISNSYEYMAHNYLQEGFDKYGIITMIALLVLTGCFFRNVIRLISIRKKIDIDFLLISMYIAIIPSICLEPVFDGYPVIFMCLLIIHGMSSAYLREKARNESDIK